MKTLILTRHAKSSWDDLTLQDHDRRLNKRGRASAKVIGQWLTDNNHLPEEVLSSTAERCRETWDRIALQLASPPSPNYFKRLYLPAPETMYEVLKHAKSDTVMMLSHNPGISTFARQLVKSPPLHPKFDQYPTAATTIITFDIPDWSTPFLGTGTVTDFIVPRELLE